MFLFFELAKKDKIHQFKGYGMGVGLRARNGSHFVLGSQFFARFDNGYMADHKGNPAGDILMQRPVIYLCRLTYLGKKL